MIDCFPNLFPDELLYSGFARYTDLMRYPSSRSLMVDLFGTSNVTAVVDLPSYLGYFAANLLAGTIYTVDHLIDRHTLLPFYTAFRPNFVTQQLRADMCGSNGPAVHFRAGIMASRVVLPDRLRYCPHCVEADRVRFGEAYWRRVHQLPGIQLCAIHGIRLHDSSVAARREDFRHTFVTAEQAIRTEMLELLPADEPDVVLLSLAQDAEWLLNQNDSLPDIEQIRQGYLRLLGEKGYVTRNGNIRTGRLITDLRSSFSHDTLSSTQCQLNPTSSENWLVRLVGRQTHTQHPVRHLLLMRFLGCSAQSFAHVVNANRYSDDGTRNCLDPACEPCGHASPNTYAEGLFVEAGTAQVQSEVHCLRSAAHVGKAPGQIVEAGAQVSGTTLFDHKWDSRLAELWQDTAISLRAIARDLKVDPRTVKHHALRFDLKFPREAVRTTKSPKLSDRGTHSPSYAVSAERVLLDYRQRWLDEVSSRPGAGVKAIRLQIQDVYAWLYKHDRDWLSLHKPATVRPVRSPQQSVDWEERDRIVSNAMAVVVRQLLERPGRPVQITASALGRECGYGAIVRQHLDRLPLTAALLMASTENRQEFAIRRVSWTVNYCLSHGLELPRWRLIKLAGVARVAESSEVKTALDEGMKRIRR